MREPNHAQRVVLRAQECSVHAAKEPITDQNYAGAQEPVYTILTCSYMWHSAIITHAHSHALTCAYMRLHTLTSAANPHSAVVVYLSADTAVTVWGRSSR